MAFGTFIGLQDPLQFFGDADYIRTRLRADPYAAYAAEANGELVGSNFVANWGSLGVFGPLTVRPDFWDRGIAKQLLKSTMKYFAKLDTRHIGYLRGRIAQSILDYIRDLVFGRASLPELWLNS
ncbi:MAG: GNAT family N-acetyltransferase [Thermoproteota archaeon]|nr:GNAT family N-acetyltransferase [Thermoproteota archaeon]